MFLQKNEYCVCVLKVGHGVVSGKCMMWEITFGWETTFGWDTEQGLWPQIIFVFLYSLHIFDPIAKSPVQGGGGYRSMD